MRILLLALIGSIAGCAAIDLGGVDPPAISRELRDYEPAAAGEEIEPIALGQQPAFRAAELYGQPAACLDARGMDTLEAFAIAAHANTAALHALLRAYDAKRAENEYLLATGQATERQAELYRALYVDEANHARLTRLAAGAGGGLLLLILGAGAL